MAVHCTSLSVVLHRSRGLFIAVLYENWKCWCSDFLVARHLFFSLLWLISSVSSLVARTRLVTSLCLLGRCSIDFGLLLISTLLLVSSSVSSSEISSPSSVHSRCCSPSLILRIRWTLVPHVGSSCVQIVHTPSIA